VEIPFDPMALWTWDVVDSEIDDAIEKMAHVVLTSLCECSLATTIATPITLFPIHNQEHPEWQQCLTAVSNMESLYFSASWGEIAKYSRYLFNLQHNIGRHVIEQRACLNAYKEQGTFTSHAMERLRHENNILRCGAL
jgi:hypothetical protein